MVQFYNDRLTERERRRDFLRARDLLNMRRMQASAASRRQPYERCPQHPVHDLPLVDQVQEAPGNISVLWLLMHGCWQGIERRRTPRDREFHAKLRPLAKYQPQSQHEAMAEGLLLEARLRARLLVRIFSSSIAKLILKATHASCAC